MTRAETPPLDRPDAEALTSPASGNTSAAAPPRQARGRTSRPWPSTRNAPRAAPVVVRSIATEASCARSFQGVTRPSTGILESRQPGTAVPGP
jgi:hypothetical protein